MKQLIKAEFELINQLEDYIVDQQKQLEILKLIVLELKNENKRGNAENTKYFLNPINIFSFTRRIVVDWEELEQYILNDKFLGVIQSFKKFYNFPSRTVLESSVSALFWLQDIYNLSPSNLVKGEINGINYNTSLTTTDCLEIGFGAYKTQDFYHSILWLTEALSNPIVNNYNSQIKITILGALAESYFQIGDVKNAVSTSNQILDISKNPLSERMNEIYKGKTNHIMQNKNILKEFPGHMYTDIVQIGSIYPELCRIRKNENNKKSNYLNCYYENNSIPFLFIAPFKKEILSIDPLLAIFHDVISDEEIKLIQDTINGDLRNAMVSDPATNKGKLSNARVSKDTWIFKDKEIKAIRDLRKRTGDITGLKITSSEMFKINTYEVGGYYTPHYDYYPNKGYAYGTNITERGNRISTLIFYLNDVEEGGSTVFPKINISVSPKKGSALFWYNLFSSGECDNRTVHAACPILVGSKWISTIWIHERLQDIHRPCVEASRIID